MLQLWLCWWHPALVPLSPAPPVAKTCLAHSHRIDAHPHPPTSVHLLVPPPPLHSHPSPLRFFLSHSGSYKEIAAIFKRQPAGYGAWGAAETPGWATWVCLSFLSSTCLYTWKELSLKIPPLIWCLTESSLQSTDSAALPRPKVDWYWGPTALPLCSDSCSARLTYWPYFAEKSSCCLCSCLAVHFWYLLCAEPLKWGVRANAILHPLVGI